MNVFQCTPDHPLFRQWQGRVHEAFAAPPHPGAASMYDAGYVQRYGLFVVDEEEDEEEQQAGHADGQGHGKGSGAAPMQGLEGPGAAQAGERPGPGPGEGSGLAGPGQPGQGRAPRKALTKAEAEAYQTMKSGADSWMREMKNREDCLEAGVTAWWHQKYYFVPGAGRVAAWDLREKGSMYGTTCATAFVPNSLAMDCHEVGMGYASARTFLCFLFACSSRSLLNVRLWCDAILGQSMGKPCLFRSLLLLRSARTCGSCRLLPNPVALQALGARHCPCWNLPQGGT